MYNEEEIEDSIRFCKEMDTYYKSKCFENPKNVFDWEQFLPIAKVEVEQRHEKRTGFDDVRLQQAIAFANEILDSGKSDTKQHSAREAVSKENFLYDTAKANGTFSYSNRKPGGMEVMQTPEGVTIEQILVPKEEAKRKKKEKEKDKTEQPKTDIDQEEEEEEVSFAKIMLQRFAEVVICIGIAFGLSAGYNRFIGTHTIVEGTSMETTLHDEDNLIINKIGYRLHEPERFDIVVFPYDDETYYIKRIIALPNETVQIIDGKIYINGEILQENYGLENIDNPGDAVEPVTLGNDEYFVMGDNRNQSKDSRSTDVGLIKKDKIIGKAVFRLYPFDSFGKIE